MGSGESDAIRYTPEQVKEIIENALKSIQAKENKEDSNEIDPKEEEIED